MENEDLTIGSPLRQLTKQNWQDVMKSGKMITEKGGFERS